ncbi:MAG: hypothetical protein AB1489_27890 [Acidobacteriota bacterium]
MKRTLLLVCILALMPMVAQAYTLVLKDGRRIEVNSQYRIVNNIAIFSLPEGNRFSISLQKINVDATELANGQEVGTFLKNATDAGKLAKLDQRSDNPSQDNDSPLVASSRAINKKLTNSDFERYRVRREEMSREAERLAAARAAAQLGALSLNGASSNQATTTTLVPSEADKQAELLAQRRELEKNKEEYWRGRARPLLTQLRVLEEQIVALSSQIDENRRSIANSPNVSIYNPPPVYPGVIIGGVPIGIGAPRTTGGVVVIRDNPNQQRGISLQDRLVELQLQYQETAILYEELREEARRAGALPGWLR